MILNRMRLLIGTFISSISGVEHGDPGGTATVSEQLHDPWLCQLGSLRKVEDRTAHNAIDENRIRSGRSRTLNHQQRIPIVHPGWSIHHDSLQEKRGLRGSSQKARACHQLAS